MLKQQLSKRLLIAGEAHPACFGVKNIGQVFVKDIILFLVKVMDYSLIKVNGKVYKPLKTVNCDINRIACIDASLSYPFLKTAAFALNPYRLKPYYYGSYKQEQKNRINCKVFRVCVVKLDKDILLRLNAGIIAV
jgi:hypothetical protein